MERWYVLKTKKGKEQEAAELVERCVNRAFWRECRILWKTKVFRSGGVLHLLDDLLFPGYLFIRSGNPEGLALELLKSRELPQMIQSQSMAGLAWRHSGHEKGRLEGEQLCRDYRGGQMIAAVEEADLCFLKHICGENLHETMGISMIVLDGNKRIIRADGVLSGYLDRVVRLNLHKRFAIVETPLFNRMQPILFGVSLEKDLAV